MRQSDRTGGWESANKMFVVVIKVCECVLVWVIEERACCAVSYIFICMAHGMGHSRMNEWFHTPVSAGINEHPNHTQLNS